METKANTDRVHSRGKPLALVVAALLLLLGVILTADVARKLGQHQREHGRTIYVFSPIPDATFLYAGRTVTLTDKEATQDMPHGGVRLEYGDQSIALTVPYAQRVHTDQLPGLYPHEDWLRVLRFAPLTGRTAQQLLADIEAGTVQDRLCIVARIPRPGANAETWGRVWKRDWTFDIHELMPDGTIVSQRFAYPQGRPYDEQPPLEVGGIPTLQPGTWQHDAALHVMPEGSGPKIRIIDSALRSVGWPFAGAVICISLAVVAGIIALIPSRAVNAQEPRRSPPASA